MSGCYTDDEGHLTQSQDQITATFALSKFEISDTTLSGVVSFVFKNDSKIWNAGLDINGNCVNSSLLLESHTEYISSFSFSAALGGDYTSAQAQDDALAMLNHWDMTDDLVYPWRTDGNCSVAPLVIVKEANNQPVSGYCDTEPNAASLAIYDGSIYGVPLPVKGVYDKGWFDWREDKQIFTDDGSGDYRLCYRYGSYAPSYLPSMATHWTDGADDTSDRGGQWQPFSRFKYNSTLPVLPPFVNNSGAWISNDTEWVWASKWAEIKEMIPSQNYWGECGAMRDMVTLDGACIPTATKRYPNAYPICGKTLIQSITAASGIVTVTHNSTPYLRTGDSVDFLDASNNVTVANVVVTVTDDNTFHFTGALPTGVAIKSHGAPNPVWYDLAPKGYFVHVENLNGVVTSDEGNVKSNRNKIGIIAIVPPGSQELTSPKWPAATTVFYKNFPSLAPTDTWVSIIQQGMTDRFWVHGQDDQMSDGGDIPACINNPAAIAPTVEARLHAPTGAPLQFAADNGLEWVAMPAPSSFWTQCSGVWNLGETAQPFTQQFGVGTGTADLLNAEQAVIDASATDAGLGTADGTFIP